MIGAGCRPEVPVAERGPVGFSDGGNRRDWFPEVRGPRAASCAEWNHKTEMLTSHLHGLFFTPGDDRIKLSL
jgi:hypothetical protein